VSLRRVIVTWLPLAVAITALSGLVYVVVQQSYRMSANDLPTGVAVDAAAAIGLGLSPATVVGSDTVDIATSLVPPAGVLAAARSGGTNKITWQPRSGVRMASVAVRVPGGNGSVVFAGQSLREAEAHIGQLGMLVASGWLAALGASLAASALGTRCSERAAP
jgi:hypothetical protein